MVQVLVFGIEAELTLHLIRPALNGRKILTFRSHFFEAICCSTTENE